MAAAVVLSDRKLWSASNMVLKPHADLAPLPRRRLEPKTRHHTHWDRGHTSPASFLCTATRLLLGPLSEAGDSCPLRPAPWDVPLSSHSGVTLSFEKTAVLHIPDLSSSLRLFAIVEHIFCHRFSRRTRRFAWTPRDFCDLIALSRASTRRSSGRSWLRARAAAARRSSAPGRGTA